MTGESVKNKNFKKFIPGLLLVLFTVILMFYFKENRGDFGEIVNKGTDDLLSLYTENLKPLLFGTDISNEDVFNFALYQTLPIDKKDNKVLRVSQKEGNTNYEVLPNSYKPGTDNYENFVKYMAFNSDQKTQLDSILESYQPELAEAVFSDGENTYAVNPRLASLQKAVLTDIAAFSRDANKPKLSSLFGKDLAFVDSKKAMSLIDEIKRDTTREYLIISGDTAFTSRLDFNQQLIESELKRNKEDVASETEFKVIAKNIPKPPKVKQITEKPTSDKKGFSYSYTIPDFNFGDIDWKSEQMDSLKMALDLLQVELNNLSINFDAESLEKKLKLDVQALKKDSLHSLSLEFNFDNLGEIINKSIEGAMSGEQSPEYWEKFGKQMDSLANAMVKAKEDSMKIAEETLKKLEDLKNSKGKKKKK